jgi:hypothetical protein
LHKKLVLKTGDLFMDTSKPLLATPPPPVRTVRVIFSLPSLTQSRAASQGTRLKETARLSAKALEALGPRQNPTSLARRWPGPQSTHRQDGLPLSSVRVS